MSDLQRLQNAVDLSVAHAADMARIDPDDRGPAYVAGFLSARLSEMARGVISNLDAETEAEVARLEQS